MCFIGGSSSNTKEETNVNETNSTNTGYSDISGEVVNSTVNASGNSRVTMSDYGSIRSAMGLAGDAIKSARKSNAEALKAVKEQTGLFTQQLSKFAETTSTNNDQRITTTTKWVIGGLVVMASVMAFKGARS